MRASPYRPFDLHVSCTPPAFILSQDQTLRMKGLAGTRPQVSGFAPLVYLGSSATLHLLRCSPRSEAGVPRPSDTLSHEATPLSTTGVVSAPGGSVWDPGRRWPDRVGQAQRGGTLAPPRQAVKRVASQRAPGRPDVPGDVRGGSPWTGGGARPPRERPRQRRGSRASHGGGGHLASRSDWLTRSQPGSGPGSGPRSRRIADRSTVGPSGSEVGPEARLVIHQFDRSA